MKSQAHSVDAVSLLLQARSSRDPLDSIPDNLRPKDLVEAYKFQDSLVNRLLADHRSKTIGYKVACTSQLAQDILKVREPFYGRMMSHSSFADGVELAAKNFFFRCMEAEFGVKIGRDLPARPINPQEAGDYVETILPSIEIVDSRFAEWLKIDAASHVVDNACHGAWIHGQPCSTWKNFPLAEQKVELYVNGQLERQGSGAAVLGNPLNVVAWLANALHKNGKQLKAGEYISTGITTNVYFASPGDKITADFGKIGRVELSFSA